MNDGSVQELSLSNHTHSQYAATEHTHDTSDVITGTLPLSRGGTGVATLDALKALLNIPSTPVNIVSGYDICSGRYISIPMDSTKSPIFVIGVITRADTTASYYTNGLFYAAKHNRDEEAIIFLLDSTGKVTYTAQDSYSTGYSWTSTSLSFYRVNSTGSSYVSYIVVYE